MDVNFEARIFADEGAGSGSVDQVYVSEENGRKVSDGQAVVLELLVQSVESGGGTRIDKRGVLLRNKKSGGNRARMADPVEIHGGGCVHE
jgi:hypothetical protein